MDPVRLVLLLGLVLHKLVWELYRVRSPGTVAVPPDRSPRVKLIKFGKIVVLALLIVQTLFLNVLPISNDPVLVQAIGLGLFLGGLALAISGRVQLGTSWANIEDSQSVGKRNLVQEGIYRYVRHPIYTGDILLLIGLELALNSWLVFATIVPIAIFLRQAIEEEKVLARSFQDYAAYTRQTKRFVPFVF